MKALHLITCCAMVTISFQVYPVVFTSDPMSRRQVICNCSWIMYTIKGSHLKSALEIKCAITLQAAAPAEQTTVFQRNHFTRIDITRISNCKIKQTCKRNHSLSGNNKHIHIPLICFPSVFPHILQLVSRNHQCDCLPVRRSSYSI